MFTSAFAQAAGGSAGSDIAMQLLPLVVVGVIFYFLLIRPQQTQRKTHSEMIRNVRRGDVVVTSGGFVAKVTKVVDDNEVEVELADNVRVRLMRAMISEVRSKSEPVKADAGKA